MDVDSEDHLLNGDDREGLGAGLGEGDLTGLDVDQLLSEEDQSMEGGSVTREVAQGTIKEESEEVVEGVQEAAVEELGEAGGELGEEEGEGMEEEEREYQGAAGYLQNNKVTRVPRLEVCIL